MSPFALKIKLYNENIKFIILYYLFNYALLRCNRLTLDPKLSFVKHIAGKIQIARKGIGVIRYFSPYVSVGTLVQLYKLFVRPHFEYADVIYHVPQINNPFDSCINLNNLMNSIEQIQYQAARVVTGNWKGTITSKVYDELE